MFTASDEAKSIVESFESAFSGFKEKKILLYGMGINTKALLRSVKEFNIIGVMDAKHEGELFEGLKVFTEEEAQNADIIVIVARAAVVPLIYNRIKHLEKLGIGIYDASGKELCENDLEFQIAESVNEEEIKKQILCHDTISFDIFDTLICRSVVRPEDIYEIVGKRLVIKGIDVSFPQLRKQASEIAYKKKCMPTFTEIYENVREISGLTEDVINIMMEEELKAEEDYILPRLSIISLLQYARNCGKKIILVSDMYLSESQIQKLLDICGVGEVEKIFISCEHRKAKWPEGILYQKVKEYCSGEKVLHIGDSEGADIECAKKQGVDAIRILSIYEILVHSPFQILLSYNRTLEDSIAIGRFAGKYLENIWKLRKNEGILYLDDYKDAGYISCGPLVSGYLMWIKKIVEKKKISDIAFMARDGWILEKAWQIMKNEFPQLCFPKAKYILGSRRALTVSALRNENDVMRVLERVPSTMGKENILYQRFGIEGVVDEKWTNEECIRKNMNAILYNAVNERNAYKTYINETIGQGSIAVVDAVSSGTIGKYFFEATDRQGCLLCMVISNVPDYSVCDEIDCMAYMGEDSKYLPKWNIHKYVGDLEGILTAPVPMFICFGDDGTEKYGEAELSQRNKSVLAEVQEGILDYINEWCMLIPDLETAELTPALADAFFGLLCKKKVICKENLMDKLGVSNVY